MRCSYPAFGFDTDDSDSLKNSYIYDSGGNVLAQRYYSDPGDPDYYEQFFYVADRLGSVRLVIDVNGDAANSYSYNPFGLDLAGDCVENPNVPNPFKFTGQWFDKEIGQYYLRARMYDPALMRFTDRDPILGNFEGPLTLHPYLYCMNDSVNNTDPAGEFELSVGQVMVISALSGMSCYAGAALVDWAAGRGGIDTPETFLRGLLFAGVTGAAMGPLGGALVNMGISFSSILLATSMTSFSIGLSAEAASVMGDAMVDAVFNYIYGD